jgi:hypothetical protein
MRRPIETPEEKLDRAIQADAARDAQRDAEEFDDSLLGRIIRAET